MYIRYLEISKFRGISDFKAFISKNILSIVGQNDVGKSSVLQALCTFFEKYKVSKADFQNGSGNSPIEITIHFSCEGLDPLKHEGLIKIKQIYKMVDHKIICEKKVYKNLTTPEHHILENYTSLKSLAKSLGLEVPPRKPSEEAIRQLRESVIATLESRPSSDWVDVNWSEIQGFLPELILIPASQDHEAEQKMSSDSSLFGKLFRVGIRNWLKADQESLLALETINAKVEAINSTFLKIVEDKLKEQLPLAENLSQEIDPLDISKGFSFTMQVEDRHGIKTPLNQRGSGLQRAVLVAVIRAQSEINKEIAKFQTTIESGSDMQEPSGELKHVLYLFEEPEAFLHLSAQKDLFYSLKDLASQNNQIVLTTHSTLFIDQADMDDVVLLVRENGETVSRQHVPRDDIRDQLGERVKLSKLLTSKVCCLVEGLSDKFAFERWASRLGYDLKREGIHIISMDGCHNMDYFANVSILNDFNVPFRIILDSDSHGETNSEKRINILKEKIPRLKQDCFVLLKKGELENYYCIDTTASVLNIPREYIDDEQYRIDPKRALDAATQRAIEAGSNTARKYQETKHSRLITERMAIENLDIEIVEIVHRLCLLSKENKEIVVEARNGLMQVAASFESVN